MEPLAQPGDLLLRGFANENIGGGRSWLYWLAHG